MPLMPCSAFKVTLMNAVTTPMTTPTPMPDEDGEEEVARS